jgi:hypothetical protein
MIILTKAECLAARFVVQDAAEHKELDAPTASILLGAIHDALEAIKIEPIRYLQLDA